MHKEIHSGGRNTNFSSAASIDSIGFHLCRLSVQYSIKPTALLTKTKYNTTSFYFFSENPHSLGFA